jgi:hypothetical protein
MKLGKGIVIHISEEARKNWEQQKEKPIKKCSRPSCELEQFKRKGYIEKEIKDEVNGE